MSDVVCLGETMAMVTASEGTSLRHATQMNLSMGGAESNVALGLAAMGVAVRWISRVGADPFGHRICAELAEGGVDTSLVEVDSKRNTGLYVKVPATSEQPASVIYYRAGSAASAMSPDFLRAPERTAALSEARLIHISGITAGLSDDCAQMLRELLQAPRRARICFDVNWRAALWGERDKALLRELANLADIVMVGLDEAVPALGAHSEEEIRQILDRPSCIVVKNEDASAVALTTAGRYEVPSLQVEVVEPVGAGDSFAAGYLSGVLAGLDERAALRRGHLAAACTLTVRADRGKLPAPEILDRLLSVSDTQWTAITVSTRGIVLNGTPITEVHI
ncbi:sugar kinase [Glutamicibacter sp. PS]|uniref:sugar kinase n=1 Tax=Glutamicibacter sp. PS TaxID=3075634 RepID=UPI00284F5C4A|nr:sugar kinase [Glutamicibacter sp. PS]MDR4534962.1 sugar kinase [Glutamicibacter sp. PS]